MSEPTIITEPAIDPTSPADLHSMSFPSPPPTFPTTGAGSVAAIPISTQTGYTQWLPEAGFPDSADAANAFAAGQRANVRGNHNRNTSTPSGPGGDAGQGVVYPAPPGATINRPPIAGAVTPAG